MKLCGWQRLCILFGIAFSLNLFIVQASYSASVVVINGLPAVKVMSDIDGTEKVQLTADKALEYRLLITKKDEKYYWASRENVEMIKIEGTGAFITFLAVNGSGYARVIKPELKEAASLLSKTEESFDYVEHLTIGLRSINYWGERER